MIPYPIDDHTKFIVDGKKEIRFHISEIDCPHQVWKKLRSLFEKFNERQIMQFEKELISLDPHSFGRIEDYLVCVKELQLKLGECGKNY
jgi:hypothetical protein